MSALDITGAVVFTPLAILCWAASVVPSKPPHPPYGSREAGCFFAALTFSCIAVYSIARLFGASL